MIRIKTQNILDRYGSGLQLVGINLNKVYPPQEVAQSFQDVSNARQDQEKMVNDSMGYRNTIIPQARGEAENISRQAEGYRAEAINTARGEAGRFEQMLAEYNKDRLKYTEDVTKTRLYLESMEKVMAKVKNIIVNPEENGELNLRILVK
jgi:membrane protease subunit HflK